MPLYDVECPAGHRREVLWPAGTESDACPEDGQATRRVYGYRAAIAVGPDPDTRGMFRRFMEASQELDHGGYDGPSLWRAGKQRAAAMIEAGENPVRERGW